MWLGGSPVAADWACGGGRGGWRLERGLCALTHRQKRLRVLTPESALETSTGECAKEEWGAIQADIDLAHIRVS